MRLIKYPSIQNFKCHNLKLLERSKLWALLCSASVLASSTIDIEINEHEIRCPLDTGECGCFMTLELAKELNLKVD